MCVWLRNLIEWNLTNVNLEKYSLFFCVLTESFKSVRNSFESNANNFHTIIGLFCFR